MKNNFKIQKKMQNLKKMYTPRHLLRQPNRSVTVLIKPRKIPQMKKYLTIHTQQFLEIVLGGVIGNIVGFDRGVTVEVHVNDIQIV